MEHYTALVHVQVRTLCTVYMWQLTLVTVPAPGGGGAGREIRTAGNFTFYTSAISFYSLICSRSLAF